MPETNLPDIPDLSDVQEEEIAPWENGWYEGTVLERREFTDRNGNDRVFESSDTPAQGSGRNIRLQLAIKRQSDGRVMHTSTLVNYLPEDLTADRVKAVAAKREEMKSDPDAEWGDLFRSFMTLSRLGKLQRIAGVRQLKRNGDGGLELTPIFGKTAYFKLRDDKRNPQYKEVYNYREDKPTRAQVL